MTSSNPAQAAAEGADRVPFHFEGLLVIVGGGDVDADLLLRLHREGAALVGADGGADVIASYGLVPDAIVGDLDSLEDAAGWDGVAPVLKLEEQDTTDFEKALYSTSAPVTVALGMTGGRFDHTLAALHAVTRHAAGRHLILVDEDDLAMAATGPIRFGVDQGERVSVHPLGAVRFEHSEGLLFPLDGLTLAPGLRTGTSNAATAGDFTIVPEPEQAPWLLILDSRHLGALVAVLLAEAD